MYIKLKPLPRPFFEHSLQFSVFCCNLRLEGTIEVALVVVVAVVVGVVVGLAVVVVVLSSWSDPG